MAVVTGLEIGWMRPAVHVDGPVGVRPADVEDVEPLDLGEVDDLDPIGRQELPGDAGRLAPRVRLQLVLETIVQDLPRPRLERKLGDLVGGIRKAAATGEPDAL